MFLLILLNFIHLVLENPRVNRYLHWLFIKLNWKTKKVLGHCFVAVREYLMQDYISRMHVKVLPASVHSQSLHVGLRAWKIVMLERNLLLGKVYLGV